LVEHQPSKLRVAGSSPVARLLQRMEKAERTEEGGEGLPPLPPYRQGCEWKGRVPPVLKPLA
jgi:hypothetical protein